MGSIIKLFLVHGRGLPVLLGVFRVLHAGTLLPLDLGLPTLQKC